MSTKPKGILDTTVFDFTVVSSLGSVTVASSLGPNISDASIVAVDNSDLTDNNITIDDLVYVLPNEISPIDVVELPTLDPSTITLQPPTPIEGSICYNAIKGVVEIFDKDEWHTIITDEQIKEIHDYQKKTKSAQKPKPRQSRWEALINDLFNT